MADPSVTERSYPFATGPGAVVTEDDWSAMVSAWQDNGVIGDPSTTDLTVVPGTDQNTIQINNGSAGLKGFTYSLTAPKIMETTANPGGSSRTDLVVLRKGDELIEAVILVGSDLSALTSDMVPLGLWTQLPDSVATSSNWGSATDARWFSGGRIRPALDVAQPPPTLGALMYTTAGDLYVGASDGAGGVEWTVWHPGLGITGDPVGTTDTQTLTNKTLTSPSITTPTITSPTITGSGSIAAATLTTTGNATVGGNATVTGKVAATGGISSSATGSMTKLATSPTGAAASTFTAFTSGQWPAATVTIPPSETVIVSIRVYGRNSETSQSTLSVSAGTKVSGTTITSPDQGTNGVVIVSRGAGVASNSASFVQVVLGRDVLAGRAGQTLTITPYYMASSSASWNSSVAISAGSLCVEPSVFPIETSNAAGN